MLDPTFDVQLKKTLEEKEQALMMSIKDQFKYLHGNKKAMMMSILEDVFKEGRFPVGYLLVFAKPVWIDGEKKLDEDINAAPDFVGIEYTGSTISKFSTERFIEIMRDGVEKWADEAYGPGSEHAKTEFSAAGKF